MPAARPCATRPRACLGNPKWVKRAETLLQDVVQEDPSRFEAHHLLGNIYRAGNLACRRGLP